MKTDDLIASLVADRSRPARPPQRLLAILLPVGLVIAVVIFCYLLDMRSDFSKAIQNWHYFAKLMFGASVALVGLALSLQVARPETSTHIAPAWILVALAPLLVGLALEVATLPTGEWWRNAMGEKALYCLALVPLISAAPLAALLMAARQGAPQNPGLAGAVAGFAAGGLGAFIYSFHCNNDSPFYVALWYVAAIAIVTFAGLLAGRRLLRW